MSVNIFHTCIFYMKCSSFKPLIFFYPQNLCTEVDGHEPLITALCVRGDEMYNQEHPDAERVHNLCDRLKKRWQSLKELSQGFEEKLDVGLRAKQYYFDAAEAESWMSEKELFLMGDDLGKDEEHVQKLLKKHQITENAINDYENTIKELEAEAKKMIDEEHVERFVLIITRNLYFELKYLK